ncbi:TlpA disulfide reductase family protein [Paraprevotella xylaniphila]|uniref:TlpA disulfide reductase family protein n=1 Tax=Paraprevotella xylaniphila TaxID=454155 RepID=UPI0026DB6B9A|nr:TlpA disulfide reductase family protein [Paraprevotella xylaniphila]
MKEQILSLFLATYCGMAFAQTNYKVTFTTDQTDITNVYLCSKEDGTVLDSATCQDGKASFDGKTNLPKIAAISIDQQAKKPVTLLILDDTPATIVQTSGSTDINGSPLNRKYSEIKEKARTYDNQMKKLQIEARDIAQSHNGNLPDADADRLQQAFDEAVQGQAESIRQALEENKDNLIPALLISVYGDRLEDQYVGNYLETYAYKDNGCLNEVNQYMAALKRKAIGSMFTDFTMDDMEGTPHKLSDYVGKGNYVLVDFWASWCGPCRAEMPNVKKAYEQFHPKGFEIVGISFDAQKGAWEKGTKDLGITWPQMSDLKAWNCEAGKLYGIRGIPATILFGPDGKIVATDLRGEELQKKLEEIYQ